MATLATLNVEIGANTAGFDKGIKGVEGSLQHLGATAAASGAAFGGSVASGMDKAAAASDRAGRAMQSSSASFEEAGKRFQTVGRNIQNVGENFSKFVTLPLTLLAGASIKAYGDLQALEKGFNAVYKGAAPAAEELAKLREVAKLPGLGLKEAIQGSVNLQAVGFSAEKARKILTAFGNAIATTGGGKDDLKEVTRQLGQISSVGKVTAENLNIIKERSPLVAAAIQKAFGTNNTEELQKMGVGAEEFITKLTEELGKLPSVTGGIKNAFENMADAGFIALSSLGESLNNAFNVEGIFDSIGNALIRASEIFAGFSPEVQKTIFLFAGVAAAIGPLLIGAGALVSAWGTLGLSFAALTGPVGLAIAAVAAGAILLIANWDKVTAYFQSSGLASVFAGLGASVMGALDGIVNVIGQFAALVKPIWDGVITVFSTNFVESIRFTATALGAAFEVMGKLLALFGGTWADSWTNFKNVIVAVWNGIVEVITGATAAIVRVGGGLAGAFGMDGVKARFDEGAASINKLGDSLKTAYYGAEKLAAVDAGRSFFEAGNKAAFASQQALMYGTSTTVGITAAEQALDNFVRTPHEKKVKVTIEKVGAVEALQSNLAAGLEKIKPPKFESAGMTLEGLLGLDANRFELPAVLEDQFARAEAVSRTGYAGLRLAAEQGMASTNQVIFDTTSFMQQALGTALVSFGELIGQSFSGGFGGMQSFLNGFLGIVIDFAGQLGKVLIGLGLGALTLKSLGMNPVAAVIAGTALVALAGVAKSLLAGGPKFSGGGSGGSGTGATVTPYRSPAAAATFTTPGMGAESSVHFEIEGTKLVGVLRNTNYKDGR